MDNNLNSTGTVNESTNVNDNINVVNNVNVQDNVVNGDKSGPNFYIIAAIVVVLVLVIAVILLIFLLTGGISNRNKLTCTKTTKETGYTYTIENVFKFEDGKNTRYDSTYTLAYDSELTEDVYKQTFDNIINNPSGVSTYGFDTKISKSGNIVTITSYYPKYNNEDYDKVKSTALADGYICK